MSGIADSLARSQANIDSIANRVQDYYKRKKSEEDTQQLYSTLQQYQQPRTTQDVLSRPNTAPMGTGLGQGASDVINKPLVLPNTQPPQASSTMDALKMYLENNPNALQNSAFDPMLAREKEFSGIGDAGLDRQYKNTQIANIQSEIEARRNPKPTFEKMFVPGVGYADFPMGKAPANAIPLSVMQAREARDNKPESNADWKVAINPKTQQHEYYDVKKKSFTGVQAPAPTNQTAPIPSNAPEVDPTLHGDAYLKELAKVDPQLPELIKGLADNYTINPSTFPTRFIGRGNNAKQITAQDAVKMAKQYDASYDETQYPTRQAIRKDITSGNKSKAILSANTLVGHLKSLQDVADQLDNSSIPAYNTVANWAISNTGDPRVVKFNLAKTAVVNELANVFKQSGATDQEARQWEQEINSSQSPEQIKQSVGTAISLLGSRLNAMSEQYESGMGKPKDFAFLNKKSKGILASIGINPDDLEGGISGQSTPQVTQQDEQPTDDDINKMSLDDLKEYNSTGKWKKK
jgi:hypothetical protein